MHGLLAAGDAVEIAHTGAPLLMAASNCPPPLAQNSREFPNSAYRMLTAARALTAERLLSANTHLISLVSAAGFEPATS